MFIGSKTFELNIEDPYVSGEIIFSVATLGDNTTINANIKGLRKFDGKARCELLGLPYGCSAESIMIESGDASVAWTLKVAKDAPVGQHKSLFLHAAIPTEQGILYHNFAGAGVLRIDRPQKNENSKPEQKQNSHEASLSRLEQLRLKKNKAL